MISAVLFVYLGGHFVGHVAKPMAVFEMGNETELPVSIKDVTVKNIASHNECSFEPRVARFRQWQRHSHRQIFVGRDVDNIVMIHQNYVTCISCLPRRHHSQPIDFGGCLPVIDDSKGYMHFVAVAKPVVKNHRFYMCICLQLPFRCFFGLVRKWSR